MNYLEVEKLKERVSGFIEEVNNMKKDVTNLIDGFSSQSESEIIEENIKTLKKLTAALTMESSIESFLEITALQEEIHKMVFDLDYVIDTEGGETPEYIEPKIDAIDLTVSEDTITAKASGVTDPQDRLNTVIYQLKQGPTIVKESPSISALEEYTFDDLAAGSYSVTGNYIYTGETSDETLRVFSSSVVVEEKDEYIEPQIDAIDLTPSPLALTVKASGVTDPQDRLKSVIYELKQGISIIKESPSISALEEYTFDDIPAGLYGVTGNYTYTGETSDEILKVLSDYIDVEEEEIIIPIIGSVVAEVVNDNKIKVKANGIIDPESRLQRVDYTLFDENSLLVEEKLNQDPHSEVFFTRELATGDYVSVGEFYYQDATTEECISKNSNIVNIKDEIETEDYIASINLSSDNMWATGFTGKLEICSHVDTDFGGDWNLTFDTKLTGFTQWQIVTNIANGSASVMSGEDWEGKPHLPLGPKGLISITDIAAAGDEFSSTVIKNCKLNGQKVKLYINGELVDGEDGGTDPEPEFSFPETNPIPNSTTVLQLQTPSETATYLTGAIVIPEGEVHDKFAIYVNNNKVREEELVSMKSGQTLVSVRIPLSTLPLEVGANKISLAYKNLEDKIYESNEVVKTVEAPEKPSNELVGYWSSWGGNGPTDYIDLEDIPSEYSTVVVSFIEHEADNVTPKFDPTDSGQITEEEFKTKVKVLQARGVKVIIAIGGQNGVFRLSTLAEKETFKSGVIGIISEYGFDGYDIDLEGGSIGGIADYTLMVDATKEIVEHFRATNPNFVYSMAPEVAYLIVDGFGDYYTRLINEQMDLITYIHPQYYNAPGTGVFKLDDSGVMAMTSNDVSEQEDFIAEFTHCLTLGHDGSGWGIKPAQTFPIGPIPAEKLIIGLPAGTGAAGTGAIDDMDAIKRAWNELSNRNVTGVRGFMTWSIDWDQYHNWQFKNMVKSLG